MDAATGREGRLEVVDLCKRYGKRQVLAPLSFSLDAGEALGLCGENGSGKSTLLRLLAQVQRPSGGDVRFDGRSVLGNRAFLRRHVGYVPQENGLLPELTVRQQLQLWQSACGLSGPLPEDILTLMGLTELLACPIHTLSGGTGRRVSIAMSLLSRPDILLMDEATVGLDGEYIPRLLSWLEDFLRQGGRLLWCSHRPEELRRLCPELLRLSQGRLLTNIQETTTRRTEYVLR